MIAETERTMISEDEVVDLDVMTTEELLIERRTVMHEIQSIDAQLKDKDRRPSAPEDDSPAWDEYRGWRRRARWAFVYRKKELQDIKQVLTERRDVGAAGNLLKLRETDPAAYTAQIQAAAEKNRKTVEAIRSTGLEAMMLRAFRVFCHMHPAGSGLPDAVDARDRETLHELALFLRQTYGHDNVHKFVHDLLEDVPA